MRLATAIAVVLGLLLAGCGGGGGHVHADPAPAPEPAALFASDVRLSTLDGLETDEFWYGEAIVLTITVHNLGAETRVMRFPSSPFLDYDIRCLDGCLTWCWSETVPSSPVDVDVVLAPYESRSWYVVWHQEDRAGFQVAPGVYAASAWLPHFAGSDAIDADTRVLFRIVGPSYG
ncbi:MAG TPA: BsuPI-related putative proteinase inhibitor [Planctomycetota bacterium]|nr:BsuPI-related putative proteinase inhibitor [Planctomycetota bacterium]